MVDGGDNIVLAKWADVSGISEQVFLYLYMYLYIISLSASTVVRYSGLAIFICVMYICKPLHIIGLANKQCNAYVAFF